MVYRGQLTIKEQGRPGSPIRLTRDPSWGDGPATIAGSQLVTGWTKGAADPRIPEPGAVWKARLDFAPRTLWMIDADGDRDPHPPGPAPELEEPAGRPQGPMVHLDQRSASVSRQGGLQRERRCDTSRVVDQDFVAGALIYSEFGWVMGTPYPTKVNKFDPADGSVQFAGWTGGGNASIIFRGMRYYLEDKPQYLDDPDGEFWFDKQGAGGTLYARLPAGHRPEHGADRGRPACRPVARNGCQAPGDQRPRFPLDHAALGVGRVGLGFPHQAVRRPPGSQPGVHPHLGPGRRDSHRQLPL